MHLILGGAWQGKLTWAVRQYGFAPDALCDLAQSDPLPGKRCYYHLEAWTRRGGTGVEQFPADAVVISREVGSGVVPMEAGERAWREAHGSLLQRLAAQSERVTRIFCGLPQELK